LVLNSDKISEENRKMIGDLLEQHRILGEIVAQKAQSLDNLEKENRAYEKQVAILDRVANQEGRAAWEAESESEGKELNRLRFSVGDVKGPADEATINRLNTLREKYNLGALSPKQIEDLTSNNPLTRQRMMGAIVDETDKKRESRVF
jgi:hypothetical protein